MIESHHHRLDDLLSVDVERIAGRSSRVKIIIVLQPVVILRDSNTPEAAALVQETVALRGLEVGGEDAEEDQGRQELNQKIERQTRQTHSKLELNR